MQRTLLGDVTLDGRFALAADGNRLNYTLTITSLGPPLPGCRYQASEDETLDTAAGCGDVEVALHVGLDLIGGRVRGLCAFVR